MSMYGPGSTVWREFITSTSTGAATNADSLPTGTLNQNGTDVGTTVTVTNIDAGRYKATFTIPTTYSPGDEVCCTISATVSTVVGKAVIFAERLTNLYNNSEVVNVVRANTAQSGNAATIKLDASASATNSLYVGMQILLTGGTGAGQCRTIVSYTGASKSANLDRNWTTAPDSTTTFAIIGTDSPVLNSNLAVTASVPVVVIRSGTAQAGSANGITLDSGASATNNLYTEDLLTITGGTGVGQSRTIVNYVGSTKVATVDSNWVTAPDNTSTFSIYASTTASQFSAQGITISSTNNTIVLDANASSVNSVYNGSIITILSGTDAGDTREITGYVGSTKTATVNANWSVNPDTTSAYAVIPTAQASPPQTAPTTAQILAAMNASPPLTLNNGTVKTLDGVVALFPPNFPIQLIGGDGVTQSNIVQSNGSPITTADLVGEVAAQITTDHGPGLYNGSAPAGTVVSGYSDGFTTFTLTTATARQLSLGQAIKIPPG